VGACGVPQSKRASDTSGAACAGTARQAKKPAPAVSMVSIRFIASSLDFGFLERGLFC